MKRHYLLALLVLSGFAGLGYEILWIRLLALAIGSTTLSFAVVLSVFFGGLALGSAWAGRRLAGSKRPVATYAALEAATGVLGIVLYPLMKNAGVLVAAIDPSSAVVGLVLRFVVCVLLMLPPTFLMGATLPYVCLGTIDRDDEAGRGTALVYGFNAVGACLGAYLLSFWLLPYAGVFGSVLVVAGASLTVAAVAFWRSQLPGGDGPVAPLPPAEAAPATALEAKRDQLSLMVAFVGGLAATGAQVVWARLFAISLKGTAYGVGSVLVAVLVGISLGSLLAGRLARRSTNLLLTWGLVQLVLVLGFLGFAGAVPIFNYVLQMLHVAPVPSLTQVHLGLGVVWLTVLLPTVASGASLPLLVAIVERSARTAGSSLARVYVANTLGCIFGSAVVGFVLLPALGSNGTLYLLLILLVAATAVFLLIAGAQVRRRAAGLALAALVAVLMFPGFDAALMIPAVQPGKDFFADRQQRQEAVSRFEYFYEGDSASVAVSRTAGYGGWGLTLNGLEQGGRDPFPPWVPLESMLVGVVPWVHTQNPQRAMLVGLGAAGTPKALLDLGIGSLEIAELEVGVFEANDVIWGDQSPLKDPRVTVRRDDARHYLSVMAARQPRHYDIVASMPSHPWVSPSLFTREFFEIAAKNLAPGGVFSTWFGVADMDPRAVESLFGAFTQVFPHYIAYWVPEVGAFFLVGAVDDFTLRIDRLEQVCARSLQAYGDEIANPYFLPSRVVAASGAGPAQPLPVAVSTDDNAIIEFFGSRRGRAKADLLDFLPNRWLPPERIHARDREAFLLELIERALGSREGRLPVTARGQHGRRTVEKLLPALSAPAQAYGQVRLLVFDGRLAEAEAALMAVSDEALRERASRFVAAAREGPQRTAALRALPRVTPDAAALLVASGDDLTGVRVEVDGDDPIGLLFIGADEARARTSTDTIGWHRRLVRRLKAFSSAVLYGRCIALAKELGSQPLEMECEQGQLDARQAEARRLVELAGRAQQLGRHTDAVGLLVSSASAVPMSREQVELLLRAALRANDQPRIAAARETLILRGLSEATVDGMIANFRERLAGEPKTAP